jgi:hypothetical protein
MIDSVTLNMTPASVTSYQVSQSDGPIRASTRLARSKPATTGAATLPPSPAGQMH